MDEGASKAQKASNKSRQSILHIRPVNQGLPSFRLSDSVWLSVFLFVFAKGVGGEVGVA